jgi:phosphatidylglycerol:prolipoprotein diacylglycerol transferase
VLIARHPSQLYEASLEGLVLFMHRVVVHQQAAAATGADRSVPVDLRLRPVHRRMGAIARCEHRLPGRQWLTMGMLLTTPMIFIGAGMMIYAYRRDAASGNLSAVKA